MNPSSEVLRQRLLSRSRLRHWLGFARVAELGSVRKAADAIGMAQPALTGLLADLESLLQSPLFERHARGMRLTTIGAELLPTARRLLTAIDDAAEQAAALQSQAQSVVRVGAIGGAISGLLSQALPELALQHPDLLIELLEADASQLDQMIAHGDIDLAVCRAPRVVREGWRFEPLLDDRFAIVAAAGHPLATRRKLSLAQLRRETWLTLPSGSAARLTFDALFDDGAGQPRMCLVSSRVPSVLWAMLKAQPVLALIPVSVARQFIDAGELVELAFDRTLPFEPTGALVPVNEPRAGVAAFLDVLKSVKRLTP